MGRAAPRPPTSRAAPCEGERAGTWPPAAPGCRLSGPGSRAPARGASSLASRAPPAATAEPAPLRASLAPVGFAPPPLPLSLFPPRSLHWGALLLASQRSCQDAKLEIEDSDALCAPEAPPSRGVVGGRTGRNLWAAAANPAARRASPSPSSSPAPSPARWRSPRPSLAPASPPRPSSPPSFFSSPLLSRVSPPLFSLSQTLERRPQDDNHIPGAPIFSNFPSQRSRGGAADPAQGGPCWRVRSLRGTKATRRLTGRPRALRSVPAAVNRAISGRLAPQEAGLPADRRLPAPARLLPAAGEPGSQLETRSGGPWERRRGACVQGAGGPR